MQPLQEHFQKAVYQLRWRFDFRDKSPVFGMWNSSHIEAWNKNGSGLATASIEAKEIETGIVKRLVECSGSDFRNFQWLALSKVNPNMRGSVTLPAVNIGLKILTTHEEVAVLVTGQVGRRSLTEGEKGIQFATFGR